MPPFGAAASLDQTSVAVPPKEADLTFREMVARKTVLALVFLVDVKDEIQRSQLAVCKLRVRSGCLFKWDDLRSKLERRVREVASADSRQVSKTMIRFAGQPDSSVLELQNDQQKQRRSETLRERVKLDEAADDASAA